MNLFSLNQPNSLCFSELWPLERFLEERPKLLPQIRALKRRRRLGFQTLPITVLFENKSLVWWQIQEMLRIERGGDAQAREELEVYGPLVPPCHHLTATVSLEFKEDKGRHLSALLGVEKRFFCMVGALKIYGQSIHPIDDPNRTVSIHFLTFDFTRVSSLTAQDSLCFGVDHPYIQETLVIPETMDLVGEILG